eukprot:CAMPEP_0177588710 /NCGR_PEP_ID=MMETSP0419_2-20121207/6377_1 /TAXON_ID=582737 /ORGANISM="Tetraselmis sp., Strain GSL018" /LENGTH=126 /DNA_ID=CAMNT_0019078939 /DNA_START=156 /DNA_END=533 /DNA_ORIENTATION=-
MADGDPRQRGLVDTNQGLYAMDRQRSGYDGDIPTTRRPPHGRRYDSELTPGKLFVGGLDPCTTQESLVDYCSQWGELVDSVIMPGRGFGFVTFATTQSSESFLNHEEHIIDGKRVDAKPAVPRGAP